MALPKLAGNSKRPAKVRSAKDTGINRSISPLRDQHASESRGTGLKNTSKPPKYPPGVPHKVEKSGNRYGA